MTYVRSTVKSFAVKLGDLNVYTTKFKLAERYKERTVLILLVDQPGGSAL